LAKKKVPAQNLVQELDPEALFYGAMHDYHRRFEGAQKLVFKLACKEPSLYPADIAEMILEARRYVLKEMSYQVGVRKLAREKWGMVLTKPV
jgi:hypothetical protein